MKVESRTAKSIKNSSVAMAFYCLNLVLTFFSRQAFILRLGAQVLGLNATAVNLLGFLNLAELGIASAISFLLYKPLAEGDHAAVSEIVSVQGWLYRRIAWIVALGAAALMCFFPLIFADSDLPPWYPYATFGVLLFASLSGYVFNYRQIVPVADQRNYRLLTVTESIRNGRVLLQILAIVFLPHGYVWWLAIELSGSVAAIFGIDRLIARRYPWLRTDVKSGGTLRKKYPDIIHKTKQLFFHKLGGMVLFQTSPLVVYGFTSLTMVAIYTNYMFIINGVVALCNAMMNGITAGVGNLLTGCGRERAFDLFGEISSFRFLLACVCCLAMWLLAPGFVELWVGREFLLDRVSLGLLVAILYVMLTRGTVDTFIYATGLFDDVWAPAVEAAINLGASIVLGVFFGLHGILAGVLLSLVVVIGCWKPWFFFRRWLGIPFRRYVAMYARHVASAALALAIFVPLLRLVSIDPAGSWPALLGYGAIATAGFGSILGAILWLVDRGMRDLVSRLTRFKTLSL